METEIKAICRICKKEFIKKSNCQIYCSRSCRDKNWRNENPQYHVKWRLRNEDYIKEYDKKRNALPKRNAWRKEYMKKYRMKLKDMKNETNKNL